MWLLPTRGYGKCFKSILSIHPTFLYRDNNSSNGDDDGSDEDDDKYDDYYDNIHSIGEELV